MSAYPLVTNSPALAIAGYPPGAQTPSEVLERVSEKSPDFSPKFIDWIKERTDAFGTEQRDLDWRRYEKYIINENMYRGQQTGRVSRLDGTFRPRQTGAKRRDVRYTHNWIRGYSDAVTAQWTLADTELFVRAIITTGMPTDQAAGAARFGDRILDHYQRTLITEDFKQRECKLAQFTGQMIRYTYWDHNAGHNFVKRPIWGQDEIQPPQVYQCGDCSDGGPLDEAHRTGQALGADGPACAYCGSTSLWTFEPPPVPAPIITGYDQVSIGDMVTRCLPAWQCKYDRMVERLWDSLYFRWQLRVRPEIVKEAFPWWKVRKMTGDDMEPGVRTDRVLKRGLGNLEGGGGFFIAGSSITGTLEAEGVTAGHWWFRPTVGAGFTMPEDMQLGNGQIIRKGVKFKDAFPRGLYVLMVDREPLDMRNEDFRRHIQHTPWKLIPSQIDGDGYEDIVHPQKEINRVRALRLSNIEFVDGSGMIFNPQYIDRVDIPTKPYEAAPTKPSVPAGTNLNQVLMQVPRAPLPSEVPQYEQESKQHMQWSMAAYPTVTGAPDVQGNARTATGASLQSQGASAQRAPERAIRAQGDSEWGQQVLMLFQENATDEMYIPFYGRAGEMEGGMFKGQDIPQYFVVSHRPRSYIPKNESDRRNDFANFLGAFQGLQGLMMAMEKAPDLVTEAMDRFNVTVQLGDTDLARRAGRQRIEIMKAGLQQAQQQAMQMGQPQAAAAMLIQLPGVAPDFDDPHQQLIQYYSNWKLEDEGNKAKTQQPLLFQAMTMLIQGHRQILEKQNQPPKPPPKESVTIAGKDLFAHAPDSAAEILESMGAPSRILTEAAKSEIQAQQMAKAAGQLALPASTSPDMQAAQEQQGQQQQANQPPA